MKYHGVAEADDVVGSAVAAEDYATLVMMAAQPLRRFPSLGELSQLGGTDADKQRCFFFAVPTELLCFITNAGVSRQVRLSRACSRA